MDEHSSISASVVSRPQQPPVLKMRIKQLPDEEIKTYSIELLNSDRRGITSVKDIQKSGDRIHLLLQYWDTSRDQAWDCIVDAYSGRLIDEIELYSLLRQDGAAARTVMSLLVEEEPFLPGRYAVLLETRQQGSQPARTAAGEQPYVYHTVNWKLKVYDYAAGTVTDVSLEPSIQGMDFAHISLYLHQNMLYVGKHVEQAGDKEMLVTLDPATGQPVGAAIPVYEDNDAPGDVLHFQFRGNLIYATGQSGEIPVVIVRDMSTGRLVYRGEIHSGHPNQIKKLDGITFFLTGA